MPLTRNSPNSRSGWLSSSSFHSCHFNRVTTVSAPLCGPLFSLRKLSSSCSWDLYWYSAPTCNDQHYSNYTIPFLCIPLFSHILALPPTCCVCGVCTKESNPKLHDLVTRYLLHKCSAYCRRKRKCASRFVTYCKFGFPHEARKHAIVHCVDEKLKKRQKIYNFARKESEVRVNDYNPLLLLLWKANCEIQFVAESSLALANYVTGYVTKPEKSSVQEVWQEVRESVYSLLWKFGVHALCSRESGLYEACDIVLGDQSMPHKRKRRLKHHKELVEMEATDPNSEDIYSESLALTTTPVDQMSCTTLVFTTLLLITYLNVSSQYSFRSNWSGD